MNILILGRGFIGKRLYQYLKTCADIDVVKVLPKAFLDYTNPVVLTEYINDREKNGDIDIIINASGYTGDPNVDACEKEKDLCWHLNVQVPVMVENICKQNSIRYIHISSGCIYDGYDKVWSEKDEPNFGLFSTRSSWYSKTKHAAETLLDTDTTVILRIRMPFTKDNTPRNYLCKVLRYDSLISYLNSITCVEDFSVIVSSIVRQEDFPGGLYNVVHRDPVSAKDVVEIFRKYNVHNPLWRFVDINDINITANRSNCT